jgi:hypothetical protein
MAVYLSGEPNLVVQIFVAGHALARHPGIEEIGVEPYLDWNVGFSAKAFSSLRFSDEAPGQTTSETTSMVTGAMVLERRRSGVGHGKPRFVLTR